MTAITSTTQISSAAQAAHRSIARRRTLGLVLRCVLIGVLAMFVLAPLVGVLGASLTTKPFWQFPPDGVTLEWYRQFFADDQLVHSLFVSLSAALFAAVVGCTVGLLAAFAITRSRTGSSAIVRVGTLIPLLVPHLALGIAIYMFYIRFRVPLNLLTLGAAQLILVLPVIIGLLVVSLETIPTNVERAAANLGASRFRIARSVTLPLIRPALVASLVVAFIRGFDDSSIALFVKSGKTTTLPVRLLLTAEVLPGPLLAAAGSMLLLIALLLAVVIDRTIGLSRAFGLRDDQLQKNR
jgi:ABC-type spermidine/putrescine transport system permease subunit II